MKTIVPAMIAVFGIGFGAWLSHVSSRDLSLEQNLAQYGSSAYRDFIRSQSVDFDKGGDQAEIDTADEMRAEALHRIAVFSPAVVVQAVADWLIHAGQEGKPCKDYEKLTADIKMHLMMRGAVHKGETAEKVDDRSMAMVLFGCELD